MSQEQDENTNETLPPVVADPGGSSPMEPSRGIVYVLSNEAMEDYIKVGKTGGDSTSSVLGRMQELSRATGVPRPFTCEYAAVVNNYDQVEAAVFRIFSHNRVPGKEFLQAVNPLQVKAVLELLNPVEVTPGGNESAAGNDSPPLEGRRPSFKFEMAGVPLGATIQWATDPSVSATVVGTSQVEYEGENYALSRITAILLDRRQHYVGYAEQYWLYQEKTLQILRDSREI